MSAYIRYIFVFFIIFNNIKSEAQQSIDISFIKSVVLKQAPTKSNTFETIKRNKVTNDSEIEYILYALFYTYKTFLSSQDMNSCNFHPSCSEYGLQAISKKGIIKGGVMTLDRMTRCHPLKLSDYEYSPAHNKFKDPIPQ